MSKYKGLFTFDVENHRYLPVEQADGLITNMDYRPEPKLNGEVREIVRHWANLHGYNWVRVGFAERATQTIFWVESPDTRKHIEFLGAYVADDFEAGDYTIDELCGEEDE